MTDLELTKLAAEAMGFSVVKGDKRYKWELAIATEDGDPVTNYDPLKHDAQAMALVKKFELRLQRNIFITPHTWVADWLGGKKGEHTDLNRAIVECVAKMQEGKK